MNKTKEEILNMTLNYKKMCEDIDKLVNNDWNYDMECRRLVKPPKYTQKEIDKMVDVLGQVYLISHCIHCKACQRKYLI